ncbi:MAG TPA: MBL fold metallo-hydrolase [Actinospica sp.]|jgi:cyclase|nr:MBL fold metallo-hydrolase [Actinospica sp.]
MHRFQPSLTCLAPGVHAYIQPDGGWCLNNAGVIAGDGATLLVDTAATQARTEALRTAVASVTRDPVSIVVNTHHHGDHTHGNYLFADTARILGHERCAPEVVKQGDLLQRLWPKVEWGDVRPVGPSEEVRGRTAIDVGGIRVLLEPVQTAHTPDDLLAFLPEHGVLFAGDLVFSGGTPFILMGSLAGARAAVDRIRALGAQTVVAGHGPIGGAELFDVTERYLDWLGALAVDGMRAGLTPLELAAKTDLGEFAGLLNPERLPANLHRAYAELAAENRIPEAECDWLPTGTGVVEAGILDIIAFGDGSMPECLA